MTPSLIGSAAYLYPLAEALARTPSTAKLLTFSRGLATMLIKTRGDARAVALCLLSPEYAMFFRGVGADTEFLGLRIASGVASYFPIKSVRGVLPLYSPATGKTGYALRVDAEFREHIFPSGPIYMQRSGFALRQDPGSVGLGSPVRVGAVAARQNDFDYFAFTSSLSDGVMLSQGFSPDTSSEPRYDSTSGRLPVGLSAIRGVTDPYSGAELSPQTSFRPEDADGDGWPAADGTIIDGETAHPALFGTDYSGLRALSALQGVWEIDGEAWFSEAVIVPGLVSRPVGPSSPVAHPIATYDARVGASPGDTMSIASYSVATHSHPDEIRVVAGGALFSCLARLVAGSSDPVDAVEAVRHANVPASSIGVVFGLEVRDGGDFFAGYNPVNVGQAFSSAYIPICDGSPHERLLLKIRASSPTVDHLMPFGNTQLPCMAVGAAGMDWYSLPRGDDYAVSHHSLDIGGDVVLFDMRSGSETTLEAGPTSSVANHFQMFGVSGASAVIGDTSYHLVAAGRNVAYPAIVVFDGSVHRTEIKAWLNGPRVPFSASWSLTLWRGPTDRIVLCSGGGSANVGWEGSVFEEQAPIYSGNSFSSTLDHVFPEPVSAGWLVSNVASIVILVAFKVGGEAFAIVRIGIVLGDVTTSAQELYSSGVFNRVALIALDSSCPDGSIVFPMMTFAQWGAAGSFSSARIVPLGDDLVCVFNNGMAATLRQAIAPNDGAPAAFDFVSTSPHDISGLTFIDVPCACRSNKVPEFPAFEGQVQ